MRVAIVTARPRSAVSLAVPYLASDLGAASVLVVQLPDARPSLPPLRRLVDRRIRQWAGSEAGLSLSETLAQTGVNVIHTRNLDTALATLKAFLPDLVVGIAVREFVGELAEGLASPSIELTYGRGREENPQAALLWAVHSGANTVDVVYRRLEPTHHREVVYQEPVAIPFQSSLAGTVQHGVAALERRAATALAEFAAWSTGLLDRAEPIDSTPARGTPSFRDLRRMRERHDGLRREHLATAPVVEERQKP